MSVTPSLCCDDRAEERALARQDPLLCHPLPIRVCFNPRRGYLQCMMQAIKKEKKKKKQKCGPCPQEVHNLAEKTYIRNLLD